MIDDTKDIHLRLPKEIYTKLKVKCAYEGISMQDYIVDLLVETKDNKSGPSKQGSILIVDDEEIVRESLGQLLKDDYEIITAATAEEAIDLVKKRDFDVILLDIRLIGKSGLEVLREVKMIKPYIKTIMMTAYSSIDIAVECMKEGAIDFMSKPIDTSQLEKLLLRTVHKTKTI